MSKHQLSVIVTVPAVELLQLVEGAARAGLPVRILTRVHTPYMAEWESVEADFAIGHRTWSPVELYRGEIEVRDER